MRSLYFGGMLSRYTRIKQCIQFVTLALAAGSVTTAVREGWPAWTLAVAAIVAMANMRAISTSMDQKILTRATMRTSWNHLRVEYSDLWSKWYDDGAMHRFETLRQRANDLGMIASTGTPWNRRMVAFWERFVDSELTAKDSANAAPTE